jgi:hypothetical protein
VVRTEGKAPARPEIPSAARESGAAPRPSTDGSAPSAPAPAPLVLTAPGEDPGTKRVREQIAKRDADFEIRIWREAEHYFAQVMGSEEGTSERVPLDGLFATPKDTETLMLRLENALLRGSTRASVELLLGGRRDLGGVAQHDGERRLARLPLHRPWRYALDGR